MIPFLLALACQSPSGAPAPAPTTDKANDRILELESSVKDRNGGRTFTLTLDGADVLVDISDPDVNRPPIVSGTAVVEARDPEHGARFVEAAVKFLGEPDPPLGNGHPGPFQIRYAQMSATSVWAVYKLIFEDSDGKAVLMLRTFADGSRAEILKEEGGDNESLARLLAVALRDGADVDAWIPTSTAVRGSEGLSAVQWCGEGIVGVGKSDTGFAVKYWSDLRAQPAELATGPGRPRMLLADPTCTRVALAVDYPTDPDGYDSADPTEILIVDIANKSFEAISGQDETWTLQDAAWSPDGRRVALTTIHKAGAAPFPGVTRVYDAATGEVVATAEPEWDALPWRWEDQLLLRTDPFNRRANQAEWYAWSIEAPAEAATAPALLSPDGEHTLNPGRLEGADPYLTRWVGPHHVLLVGDGVRVRDVSDDSDRPFHTLGGVSGVSVDRDGTRVALLTRTGVRWAPTRR